MAILFSSTVLKQRFPNLSADKRSLRYLFKKQTQQIPLRQPRPTKLKFPGEEAWYFVYLRKSPDDSFQAIFGSTALKVLASTEVI